MSPRYKSQMRLHEADPKPLGQRVPKPLHERVEELCELLYAAGYSRPTKAKMVAALLLGAPTDPAVLSQLLHDYDAASVGACPLDPSKAESKTITYPERNSGPRGPHM